VSDVKEAIRLFRSSTMNGELVDKMVDGEMVDEMVYIFMICLTSYHLS